MAEKPVYVLGVIKAVVQVELQVGTFAQCLPDLPGQVVAYGLGLTLDVLQNLLAFLRGKMLRYTLAMLRSGLTLT